MSRKKRRRLSMQEIAARNRSIKTEREQGLACPDCGCRDLRVHATRQYPMSTRRLRWCRNCGRVVETKEEIVRDDRDGD